MSKDGEHIKQAPEIELTPDAHTDSTERHPAYGMIGANRVSGGSGAFLFGSDFRHQHYVTIQIHEAEVHRNLNKDWPMAKGRLIEVALSEAQWATFVSSMNVGDGVQCTLAWNKDEGWLPEIELPVERSTQFLDEMTSQFKDALAELKKLLTEINSNNALSKKAKEAMASHIHRVAAGLGATGDHSGLGWVERSFNKHIEHTIEKAKIEVNAYLTNAIQRAGVESLNAGDSPIAMIEGPKNDA